MICIEAMLFPRDRRMLKFYKTAAGRAMPLEMNQKRPPALVAGGFWASWD
jgi:hypothetical protein